MNGLKQLTPSPTLDAPIADATSLDATLLPQIYSAPLMAKVHTSQQHDRIYHGSQRHQYDATSRTTAVKIEDATLQTDVTREKLYLDRSADVQAALYPPTFKSDTTILTSMQVLEQFDNSLTQVKTPVDMMLSSTQRRNRKAYMITAVPTGARLGAETTTIVGELAASRAMCLAVLSMAASPALVRLSPATGSPRPRFAPPVCSHQAALRLVSVSAEQHSSDGIAISSPVFFHLHSPALDSLGRRHAPVLTGPD